MPKGLGGVYDYVDPQGTYNNGPKRLSHESKRQTIHTSGVQVGEEHNLGMNYNTFLIIIHYLLQDGCRGK